MKRILFILSIIFIHSCANDNSTASMADYRGIAENSMATAKEDMTFDDQSETQLPPQSLEIDPQISALRKMIKIADYKFEVEKINESTTKIESLVKNHGGIITAMNLSNDYYRLANEISIMIPDENFETLLIALSAEAINIDHKKINTQDVTDEYVDVKSRLNTKRGVHEKYVQLMRNKAKTIDEVIKAEEAIRHIQEEIEAKEGRLRYLTHKTSMSTINLSIYQKIDNQPLQAKEPYATAFIGKIKNGFWNGMQIVEGLILLVLNFWPLLLISGFLYWKRKTVLFKFRKSGVEV